MDSKNKEENKQTSKKKHQKKGKYHKKQNIKLRKKPCAHMVVIAFLSSGCDSVCWKTLHFYQVVFSQNKFFHSVLCQ